jgi:hypothetical protein
VSALTSEEQELIKIRVALQKAARELLEDYYYRSRPRKKPPRQALVVRGRLEDRREAVNINKEPDDLQETLRHFISLGISPSKKMIALAEKASLDLSL